MPKTPVILTSILALAAVTTWLIHNALPNEHDLWLERLTKELISHNRLLQSNIGKLDTIIIEGIVPNENGQIKTVKLTGREAIDEVLKSLIVADLNPDGASQHYCLGHIRFRFNSNGVKKAVQYDHGEGVYVLNRYESGFTLLPQKQCATLNRLLTTHGFTENDIGLTHP